MTLAALLAASALCFGGTPDGSTAITLTGTDAHQMAQSTARFLAERFPPAASTLLVVGADRCGGRDTYTPALMASLRASGFALATDREASPEAHSVKYHVTGGWQDSVILRLEIDNRETAQVFVRARDGVLREAGPLTVKE